MLPLQWVTHFLKQVAQQITLLLRFLLVSGSISGFLFLLFYIREMNDIFLPFCYLKDSSFQVNGRSKKVSPTLQVKQSFGNVGMIRSQYNSKYFNIDFLRYRTIFNFKLIIQYGYDIIFLTL